MVKIFKINWNWKWKSFNFEINLKEKIGIIGRNGSGKSKNYLFRILELLEGIINISDINIKNIGLDILIKYITINHNILVYLKVH